MAMIVGTMSTAEADGLLGGQRLERGQSIISVERKYSLAMQPDGNLVMYRGDGTVRYRFANGWFAIMQTDGNFVEYNGAMAPVFNSGTTGHPGSVLAIQDDGNLVVYSDAGVPLWNIGAEPEAKDPRLPGDVVGRDLDVPVAGFLGHVGMYDGAGQVLEADNGFSNAIRIITFNQFKSTTHNYWGTASANIPSGITAPGCYQLYCVTEGNYQAFEMRTAMARAAYATNLIGASYTLTAQWKSAMWGNISYAPARGIFRCDTFVLWASEAPPYATSSPARSKWKSFAENWLNTGAKTPTLVFNGLQSYR